MRIRRFLRDVLPRPMRLPASYYYYKLAGKHEAELSVLDQLVEGGKCAIDVGANIGFYSLALSRICERVEAFEPIPECAAVLSDFRAKNIRVHTVGLSSSSGFLTLRIPVKDGVPAYLSATMEKEIEGKEKYIQVPVRRLDDYHFTEVTFIKIDVEGHELNVIDGGKETISREKPVMLIEIEQRHQEMPIADVFQRILDMGYSGSFYYRKRLYPLADFDRDRHQKPELANTMDGRYINNFVFRPIGE